MGSTAETAEAERQQMLIINRSAGEFHKLMKASLLMKDEMPEFLSSAPMVVSLLGHLRLLAWSTGATLKIERDKNSLFKSDRLSPNLIQLHHQGCRMFEVAHEKMEAICLTMNDLFGLGGVVLVVFDCLQRAQTERKSALESLQMNIDLLCAGMKKCVQDANNVQQEITTMHEMTKELELACNDEFVSNELKAELNKIEQDRLKLDEEQANAVLKQLDGHLEEVKHRYKMAQKDVSSARFKAGGLSTFGLLALTSVVNPIIKSVDIATDLVRDVPGLIGKLANPLGMNSNPSSVGQSESPPVYTETPERQVETQPRPKEADNVVYQKVNDLSMLVLDIQSLLTSDDPGSYVETIQEYQEQIRKHRSDITLHSSSPAVALSILKECEQILKEMHKKHKTQIDMKIGEAENRVVKGWLDRLTAVGDKVSRLETQANFQPGAALGTGAPIISPNARNLVRSDGTFNANAFLVKRHEELARMEMLCSTALENYQKKAEQRAKTQDQIIQVTRKLTRLQKDLGSTDDIRKLLHNVAEILGKLQAEVSNLSRYFSNISTILKHLQDSDCDRFIKTVNGGVSRFGRKKEISFNEIEAQESNRFN